MTKFIILKNGDAINPLMVCSICRNMSNVIVGLLNGAHHRVDMPSAEEAKAEAAAILQAVENANKENW